MNGDRSGTNGAARAYERRTFWLSYLAACLCITVSNSVNVMTWLADSPSSRPLVPIIAEATSAIMVFALIWFPWVALKVAPLEDRRWWRTLAVHLTALLAFAFLHVGGFVLLRQAVWRAFGEIYRFGPFFERFPYELRKDAIGYSVVTVAFWAFRRLSQPASQIQVQPTTALPALFDIRDGARVIRVPVADILAVTSAGNYVEFLLADGRRPLMRSALTGVEGELAVLGFVRTHRSWLVNTARVRGLRPEGSGDYAVELGDVEAPLSRRFPDALARLRTG